MPCANEIALNWLKAADVRPTKQRLVLAELLVGDGKHRHVCAESLHDACKANSANVSLATIYNTLHLFSQAGLLNEVSVDGHKSYFDTRTDDHPHFYWEEDGTLCDAPKDAIKIVSLKELPENAEISRIDVVIRLRKKTANA